jgi:hypothetical protein
MPPKQYADRFVTLYFPSIEYRNEWAEKALAAKMPLSAWVFSMVEEKLAEANRLRPDLHREIEANQEELAALRRAVRDKDAVLEKYETELYNLRHKSFQSYPAPGEGRWDNELIRLLQTGRVWPGQALLDAMGMDPKNSEAMTILSRQLQALQDMGLVVEDPAGWRWL